MGPEWCVFLELQWLDEPTECDRPTTCVVVNAAEYHKECEH